MLDIRTTANPTVLVVEDNEDTRCLMVFWLEKNNYHVTQASNGHAAVEVALREHPSVILMDISMPQLDGMTAARSIRGHAELCDVPIIAVSALNADEVRGAAFAAGCNDFISKPFEWEKLQSALNSILKKAAAAGASGARWC